MPTTKVSENCPTCFGRRNLYHRGWFGSEVDLGRCGACQGTGMSSKARARLAAEYEEYHRQWKSEMAIKAVDDAWERNRER